MARNKKQAAAENAAFLIGQDTPFAIQEAYKTIRTNLLFALATATKKTVVITSSLPSEGKSTTCANLAVTMAQTDVDVLLIDADLRKPTQHKIFGLRNSVGLSSVLGGFCAATEAITKSSHQGLDIITAGPIPPNPSELLCSYNMSKLIEFFTEHYDYIFIDSPPINVVSDALLVAKQAAGLVMVARQGQTTHDELKKAITSVEFADAKILGIVISDAREDGGSYGKYGKYGKYKSYSSYGGPESAGADG